jgi:hypothetical protein
VSLWLHEAIDHAGESGLARAIEADNADAALREPERHRFEDDPLAKPGLGLVKENVQIAVPCGAGPLCSLPGVAVKHISTTVPDQGRLEAVAATTHLPKGEANSHKPATFSEEKRHIRSRDMIVGSAEPPTGRNGL